MKIKAMLNQLMLCLCGLLTASLAYSESIIIATPQLGVGIEVDVFDHPDASSEKLSSTSMVRFTLPAFYTPALQSFKGKIYMFWANNNDTNHIYYATSTEGKIWSKPQTIGVDSILSNVSVTVFKRFC